MSLILHVDGGARGNPGPSGAGVVLRTVDGRSVLEAGYWLGRMTNNQAEYRALILGLEAALERGAREIKAFGDSELIVKQVLGQYKVKAGPLKTLHGEVLDLFARFDDWTLQHVRREANSRADELVNLALDCGEDIVEIDTGSSTRSADEVVAPVAVVLQVVQSGDPTVCPAVMAIDQTWDIADEWPAMCIHAAACTIGTLLELRSRGSGVCERVCEQPGCAARFGLAVRPRK